MAHPAMSMRPTLREGDRLTSLEFIRRWEAMPDLKHAELIDGVVFCMASPVSLSHGTGQRDVIVWLSDYMDATPGCDSGLDSTWVMGPVNVPQPDVFLRILPAYGGQSSETGDYGKGAPELVVEVSGSSLSRDLGAKLELYRHSGVREYLTVLLNPRQVIWRQLVRGQYREIVPGDGGLLRSRIFPGLWLDPEALSLRKKSIRKAVGRGVKSPEHAAFVKKLAAAYERKRQ